jgi:L-alanine-DL-glutamate epimerase-like enolase superfamily enzyme
MQIWNEAAIASPRDFRAPVGAVARALSAVDQALWDAWGQQLGQPIYRLLGGAQPEIDIYTTCGLKAFTPEEEAEEVRRLQAKGFKAFKLEGSWASRGRDSKHDVARVRRLREVAGDDALIIIDGRNVFDLYQAIDIARMIEPYNVAFLDEPVQAKDPETMRRLRAAVPGVPIAARARGGNIYDIRDLVVGNAVDVLSTTVLDQGGYSTAMKTGHLAQAFSLRLVTGGGWHLQNAHFIAGMPNGWMTEYLTPAALVTDRLFIDPPHPANGKLALGDRPGLGMKLNPDAVKDGRERARAVAAKR